MPIKILLLNPPYRKGRGFNREGRCTQEASFWTTPWPPYSLASIAAVLREDGHLVEVVDCPARKVRTPGLGAIAARGAFDLVIAAVSTETIESDMRELAGLKAERDPRIAVFGVHPTVRPQDAIGPAPSGADFVILHEPEETARELAAALDAHGPVEAVRGIAYRDARTGSAALTAPRPYIADLDSLPFPAWDLVDLDRYRLPVLGRRFVIVNTVRGCPFRCSFCTAQAYYGTAGRARSVPSLIAELRHVIATVGVRDIFFWGDTFTLLKDQVRDLCRAIIAGSLSVRWVANSRVDAVDPETLALMKRAGCWLLSFGIESGDEDILRACGKAVSLDRTVQAVRETRRAGILSAGHFVFGLPGETVSSARRTVRFARRLGLDFANFYTAVPYPGSRLYDEALASGWIRETPWARFNQNEFTMDLPTVDRARLAAVRRRAKRTFGLMPRRIETGLALLRLTFAARDS
jgi:anaerobic magnesium-protoporphyrin IX monomethyl ester cyclase